MDGRKRSNRRGKQLKPNMKELKDYLHLYIGCDAYVFPDETLTNGWLEQKLKEIPKMEYKIPVTHDRVRYILERGYKPILRPISSMTEEEAKHLITLRGYTDVSNVNFINGGVEFDHPGMTTYINFDKQTPEQFAYLLSRGFDLFGLLESNLAVASNK